MGWALAYVCGFLLNKEYGFVARYNICSIICEALLTKRASVCYSSGTTWLLDLGGCDIT